MAFDARLIFQSFFLVLAMLVSGVTQAASGLIMFPNPQVNFLTVLTSQNWAIEDYSRAYSFNQFLKLSYSDLSADISITLDNVEKWRTNFNVALDVFDLGVTLVDTVGVFSNKDSIALRLKNRVSTSSGLGKYFHAMSATSMKSFDEVVDAFVVAAWYGNLANQNGIGDTGVGDLYDLILDDDVEFEESLLSYLLGEQGFFSTCLTNIVLDLAGNLENILTGETPYLYIVTKSLRILNDFAAGSVIDGATVENKKKIVSLKFLEHYLLGYNGDRAAFETKLGKAPGVVWNLKDAFKAFLNSLDYNGEQFGLTYLQGSDGRLNPIQVDSAYQDYLLPYMKSNAILAIKPDINPPKMAYLGSDVDDIDRKTLITIGEDIGFSLHLDLYLEQLGCRFSDREQPVLHGFSSSAESVSTDLAEAHPLWVDGAREISLSQEFWVSCSLADSHRMTYFFSDRALITEAYFQPSATPTISRSSFGCDTLRVSVETPWIETLFKGVNDEILDATGKQIILTLEEEVEPGQAPNIQTKPFFYTSASGRKATISLDASFEDDAFFFDHIGEHRFKFSIEIPHSGLWIEGTDSKLEWSEEFTVKASETTFESEYGDARLLVANPSAAAWDGSQGELNLSENESFQICLRETYDGTHGELLHYRLVYFKMGEVTQGRGYIDSSGIEPETGCIDFTMPEGGRYHPYKVFYVVERSGYPDGYLIEVDTSIDRSACMQIAGLDEPPDGGGGGTPGPEYPANMPLNDTGIAFCSAAVYGNNTPCNGTEPVGQDAHYGRDAAAAAGQLTKIGGGSAGFDFTKIANNGSVLPASATLGSGPADWACTRDNVTGLIWEVKTDAGGLRDQDWGYTWYDTDSPNGYPGSVGTTSTCNNTLGGQPCDTETYVAAVNAVGLCGAQDWRMPRIQELFGIVNRGGFSPAIDPDYFPYSSSSIVWSGSPSAGHWSSAWVLYGYGTAYDGYDRSYDYQVRLVRGGQ